MQELYYTSASASLTLVKDNNTTINWNNIDTLIVCSSLYEIVAISQSKTVVSFPIENTNVYYAPFDYNNPFFPPATTLQVSASLDWYVYLIQNELKNEFISGSGGYIYSGSNYYVSQSALSNNGSRLLDPSSSYTLLISGANDEVIYNTYIYIYDTTTGSYIPGFPGDLIYQTSGSSSTISASFTPSSSRSYQINLALVGEEALP